MEGCERCIQILRYGGMGHTMAVHSQNDDVILQFGLKKPAFRICVNTPTTHGSIGLTTGLDPAMTLGCGGWGGNSTSDNISPRHLLNLKRVAYGLRPAVASPPVSARPQPAPPRRLLPGLRRRPVRRHLRRPHHAASRRMSFARRSISSWPRAGTRAPAKPDDSERTNAPVATVRNTAPVRVRMRRRRSPGDAGGNHDCARRKDDRHARRTRSRDGAQRVRADELAPLN